MNAYSRLAPYYDILTRDVPYSEFADFYTERFRELPNPPRTVLDLACGTGSVAVLLAERGHELICVDGSPDMLMLAREKFDSLGEELAYPLFICQNMDEIDLYGTVSAAVCSLDSLNYVDGTALSEVFRRLALFIEPGGLFCFDLLLPEHLRSLDGSVSVDEAENLLVLWRGEFDAEQNALRYGVDIFERTDSEKYRREREEHIEFAHEPERVLSLLRAAGFTPRTYPAVNGRMHFTAIRNM